MIALVTESCLTLWDPWTVAHQTPLSIGLSRQEYWSGVLFLQGIFPTRHWSCIAGGFFTCWAIGGLCDKLCFIILLTIMLLSPHHNPESESEVSQSCLTLCDPVDCSPPGSSVRGILQVRILEWVAISFSRGSSGPRDQTQVSRTAGRRFNLWATSPHHNPEVGPIVVPTSQRRKPRQLNFSRSKERSNSNYSREFKLPQSIFQNPWV